MDQWKRGNIIQRESSNIKKGGQEKEKGCQWNEIEEIRADYKREKIKMSEMKKN